MIYKNKQLTVAIDRTLSGTEFIVQYKFINDNVVGTHKSNVRTFNINCSIRNTCFFVYV